MESMPLAFEAISGMDTANNGWLLPCATWLNHCTAVVCIADLVAASNSVEVEHDSAFACQTSASSTTAVPMTNRSKLVFVAVRWGNRKLSVMGYLFDDTCKNTQLRIIMMPELASKDAKDSVPELR